MVTVPESDVTMALAGMRSKSPTGAPEECELEEGNSSLESGQYIFIGFESSNDGIEPTRVSRPSTSVSPHWHWPPSLRHKILRVDSEPAGNLADVDEAYISFAPLDTAYISPIKVANKRKRLL